MSLKNRKYIVTAGPTREWIDPIRFISNPSSGKMGIACARAAYSCGFETVLIHGPIDKSLVADIPFRSVGVETTADMLHAVQSELCSGAVLIMAAAPADYKAKQIAPVKLKKGSDSITIDFIKNPDILETISRLSESDAHFNGIILVGFAAETNDVETYALEKLKRKKLDMICVNNVAEPGAGFGVDTNHIIVFNSDGNRTDIATASKDSVAETIIMLIQKIAAKRE
jgi:phosphopantothenoylcysteine decarboxylase/phosphopantothenate--cysteine ligase